MSQRPATRPFIVGIGGTTRANSSTERALRIALQAAQDGGADVLMLGAADINLPMYAPENPHRTAQAIRLVEAVRAADGLVVASPGYHGGVSGLLKNALDYVEDIREDVRPYLEGRGVACIACASGWQATSTTLSSLRSIVHALRGWPTPLGVTINTTEPIWGADGTLLDHKVRAQLETAGRQVAEFAASVARRPSVSV